MGVALKDFGIPPPSKAKAFQHRDTEHTEIFLLFVVSGVYLTRKTGVFLEHTQTPAKQEQGVATFCSIKFGVLFHTTAVV